MAYSRFSNSIWYTFWCDHPTESNKREDQLFEICDFPSMYFTFKQLSDNLNGCIDSVKEFYSKEHEGKFLTDFVMREDGSSEPVYTDTIYEAKNPTQEQLDELRRYMQTFIKDVLTDPELVN